ncbi:MAG: SNF2-related protein [Bacteroidota bacterium]|mgnify:CR=1 FL=1
MGKHNPSQTAIEFIGSIQDGNWPPHEKYPLNLRLFNRKVESEVLQDIIESDQYLIITGFTSLSHLVDTFGYRDFPDLKKVRIVLGFEPNIKGRKQYETDVKLSKEIREYWLRNGFSITLGGAVIRLIELIDQGIVDFRFMDRLHAKIYVGNHNAILGSSNFSKSGLTTQQEANIRVSLDEEEGIEQNQYEAIKRIAENFYKQATLFNDEIKELLKELIQQVTWQEALARAIAEVIEGDWLREYTELYDKLQKSKLWPTQWRGISQAMNILQNQSNVLIADPTGSGKTKLCSSLMLTLIHWLWENGKRDRSNSLIVCPPLVIPFWQQEFKNLIFINHNQISMGLLSNGKERKVKQAREEIAISNILTIDEAHNYIRPDSNRSRAIQSNQADHVILATATPINKRADDLLRLVQLLDVDNLSDSDFRIYKKLWEQPRQTLEREDLESLRNFISQFTIRRTKAQLNKEILKEPNKYLNRENKPCKFPEQICVTYITGETADDIQIVKQISEQIKGLYGLTHLRKFSAPDYELKDEDAKQVFISRQLKAGKALASYLIRESLRSSHVALVEHLAGGDEAKRIFEFKTKKHKTGLTIRKIEGFRNIMPDTGPFDTGLFPKWLVNEGDYHQACEVEIKTYSKILELAQKLSGNREIGKVKHLLEQHKKHRLVLAFDSTVITLDYLKSLFPTLQKDVDVYVVTGYESEAVKDKVLEMCSLGSNAKGIILCSDKMNEGVNLQQASSVTLLDMPSVLRIAEQRIGRIDRMDSPHDEIEAWWPEDSEEYSLKGDKRLIDTSILAETIYGSNLKLPKALKDRHFQRTDSTEQMIQEYKEYVQNDVEWEGIHDSFKPVVELKEGNSPLISENVYEKIKDVQTEIKTRVSFIEANHSWVFFALRGTKNQSPRWYLIDHENGFHTEFPDICGQLRKYLSDRVTRMDWNQSELDKFILKMQEEEIRLLPHKRKRALEVAKTILGNKLKLEKDPATKQKLNEVIKLFKYSAHEVIVDYYKFAEQWIRILHPYLDEKRALAKRKRAVYNLSSLIRDYKKIQLSTDALNQIIQNCPYTEKIDNRIVACIIGVGLFNNQA